MGAFPTPQEFEAALVNSLTQQLSFIGLPCTCTLLSYTAVPGYTVEAQLKNQTGLATLLGQSPSNDTNADATTPGPECALIMAWPLEMDSIHDHPETDSTLNIRHVKCSLGAALSVLTDQSAVHAVGQPAAVIRVSMQQALESKD